MMEKDKILKEGLEEAFVKKAPKHMHLQIMNRIMLEKLPKVIYQPLISKRAGWIVIVIVAMITAYFSFASAGAEKDIAALKVLSDTFAIIPLWAWGCVTAFLFFICFEIFHMRAKEQKQ
jgi:uncharacterized membrane protein (DUF485 family)